MSEVSLEERKGIPKASWSLPRDEQYVRLGCAGCSHAVCFTAKGRAFTSYDSPEATDLRDLIGEVGQSLEVSPGLTVDSYPGSEPCNGADVVCPEAENIGIVVELLNERFDADLTVPKPEAA